MRSGPSSWSIAATTRAPNATTTGRSSSGWPRHSRCCGTGSRGGGSHRGGPPDVCQAAASSPAKMPASRSESEGRLSSRKRCGPWARGQGDVGGHRDDEAVLGQGQERGETTNRGSTVPEYRRLRLRTERGGRDKPAEAVLRRFPGLELERRSQHIERLGAQQASVERREAEADDVGWRRQDRARSLDARVVAVGGVFDAATTAKWPVEVRAPGRGPEDVVEHRIPHLRRVVDLALHEVEKRLARGRLDDGAYQRPPVARVPIPGSGSEEQGIVSEELQPVERALAVVAHIQEFFVEWGGGARRRRDPSTGAW